LATLGFLIVQRVNGGAIHQPGARHDPDAIHWGHVGDLGRVDQALDDLLAIFERIGVLDAIARKQPASQARLKRPRD